MHTPLAESDPRVIGSYRLGGRLGAGGAGIVYLGMSPTGMRVAVKVLRHGLLADPEHRRRFAREVRAAQSVPPFCTAEIIEADTESDTPFLVTQYIDGLTLAETVRARGPLAGSELDYIAFGMAGALAAVHKAKITHRDLSPKNVILGTLGLRVIDFGLALLSELDDTISGPGQVVGTRAYMAPEQLLGERVGGSADIYSWGAVVCFAATGRPPRTSDDVAVEGPLGEIVLSALNRAPSERPTAAELLDRLLVRLDSPSEFLIRAAGGLGRSVRPQTAEGWADQAKLDLEAGRLRLALFRAQEGRRLDSLSARCHFYEGLARIELDEPKLGAESIRLAYEIDPTDRAIALGYARYLSGTSPEGSRAAYAIAPEDPLVRARHLLTSVTSGDEPRLRADGYLIPPDPLVRARHPLTSVTSRDEQRRRCDDDVAAIEEAVRLAPTEQPDRRQFVRLLLSQGPEAVHKTYHAEVDKEPVPTAPLETLLKRGHLLAATALAKAAYRSLTSAECADWERLVVTKLREMAMWNTNGYSPRTALLIAQAAQQASRLFSSRDELVSLQDRAFDRDSDEDTLFQVGCALFVVALVVGIVLIVTMSVPWVFDLLMMVGLFAGAIGLSALAAAPAQLRKRRRAHAARVQLSEDRSRR